jgi:ABC-type arginine/histidine transport system permease subunit
LMGAARQMIATDYKTTQILLITGCIYLILALVLIGLLNCFKPCQFVWKKFKYAHLFLSSFSSK